MDHEKHEAAARRVAASVREALGRIMSDRSAGHQIVRGIGKTALQESTMSDETIVAIYDTPAHAQLAAGDLRQAGVPDRAITIHVGSIDPDLTGQTARREPDFWSKLFGGRPDHDTMVYERSVGDGSSVLVVETPEQYVARVMEIVESHDPIDIDERAARYGANSGADLGAWAASTDDAASSGSRVANRGGSRVRRFVADRP